MMLDLVAGAIENQQRWHPRVEYRDLFQVMADADQQGAEEHADWQELT